MEFETAEHFTGNYHVQVIIQAVGRIDPFSGPITLTDVFTRAVQRIVTFDIETDAVEGRIFFDASLPRRRIQIRWVTRSEIDLDREAESRGVTLVFGVRIPLELTDVDVGMFLRSIVVDVGTDGRSNFIDVMDSNLLLDDFVTVDPSPRLEVLTVQNYVV